MGVLIESGNTSHTQGQILPSNLEMQYMGGAGKCDFKAN